MNVLLAALWLRILCCVLGMFAAAQVHAEAVVIPRVHFAGIAYTGSAGDAARRLPYAHSSIERRGRVELNGSLTRALKARPSTHFELLTGEYGSLDGIGSAVVMAISIDRETVVKEPVGGRHKLLYELAAQALFFDFKAREVLFSYPITLQSIELYPEPPTSDQIQAVADQVLLGDQATGLAATLAKELALLELPSGSARRLQVTEVRMSDVLAAKFPGRKADVDVIGQEFSKVLASTLRLPMLPHRAGQAVGGTMATQIADGKVFNLTIPSPDYAITLEVDDFRNKTLKETPAFRQQLYGAFFNVRVVEPLSGKVYLDQPLRFGATKNISVSQTSVDEWAVSYETLLGGFSAFSQAAGAGNPAWSREQSGGKAFTTQLKALKELIQQCR